MAAPTNKKYGLITLPKKGSKAPPVQRPNIFDDDSDEDAMAAVNREIVLSSQKNKAKRQTQLEIDRALADDPSVYSYDEVYDDMKKEEKKLVENKLNVKQNEARKPKYMTNLLKAAEKRNKEHERRAEKKVQKEREAEGDEFADKEKFVTSAYKKKMAEMEALEAEEKRKEAIEDALDVTKQADMSGFYRNFYKQTVGSDPSTKQEPEAQVKTEPDSESPSKIEKTTPSKRQYRQRDRDSSSPELNHRERSKERKKRSTSRERRQRSRSKDRQQRSKDRRQRSRSKDRQQKSRDGRRRSTSRDRRRRSRDRSRSRNRSRRSRSRGQQERSERRSQRAERHSKDTTVKRDKSPSETKPPAKENSPQVENGDQPTETNTGEVKERFAKRNTEETVQSARERYLARKAAKMAGE